MDRKHYRTGEFASRAAVTVRTLRWYDRVGLLKPSQVSDAGHRLYTDHDLIRLEQILALKFLGLSLDEISQFLQKEPDNILDSLARQKEMMKEQRHHLDRVIRAIEWVEGLSRYGKPEWESLIHVIQVMQMEPKKDWWKKYYTEEQVQKLEERQKHYTEEDAMRDAARWNEVIADLKRLAEEDKDPADPQVQEVARRWWGLIQEFIQGDKGIFKGLNKMYCSEESQCKKPYGEKGEQLIQRALEIYRASQDK
ncbi:MerR family transcriptional regulator [Desmospora activa]|uniref:DNA-binding transcriptional MerR regulator n=1 Tax=Desmospora activa DSM 45169 TaxID=1121389 RepID=A0A2T4Z724_9BACL|nr:MerR family transcriptional regulator [Desmospora activa]PTM57665.1 DNA-binding transcriptional MerR regulator [Desmospora activa DSM 45169]